MKKNFKKRISILLAIAILVLCMPQNVLASEFTTAHTMNRIYGLPDYNNGYEWDTIDCSENVRSTPVLTNCSIARRYSSEGLHIEIITTCSHQSEEVGVRDVKIQKQVGIFWSTVATSPGGSCGDDFVYGGSLLYSNVEYGATYRVSCVHFAYCGGYDLQAEHVTEGAKCIY